MAMKYERKSGYTVPYNMRYGKKLYEIGTTATSGFRRKTHAEAYAKRVRSADGLARVKRFSRKVSGENIVRYHVYVRYWGAV